MKWDKLDEFTYAVVVPGGMVIMRLQEQKAEEYAPAMVYVDCGKEAAQDWIDDQGHEI